ncbi:putative DNA polymerase [Triangularia verruculosa]|uniref:DNA polymerase n=1 Tax=Triangularia verruculosa TaxID=2587418 RepID=A0AAN6XT09_9PEZI|nr:putative DNA polymerase [Triangularia verruculosa]
MPADLDFPVIFLLPSHLGSEELQELEDQIPTLTYDINEAEVVLGKISRKERALFELRKRKIVTEEVEKDEDAPPALPPRKRMRLSATPALGSSDIDSDTCSEGEIQRRLIGPVSTPETEPTIKVVKLTWFTDSLAAGQVLPLDDKYVIYRGRKVMQPPPAPALTQTTPTKASSNTLKRAHEDSHPRSPPSSQKLYSSQGSRSAQKPGSTYASHPIKSSHPKRPALLRQTTSEHDLDTHLPPIPPCLHTTYSCQRSTPANPPNQDFIAELLKIRLARTLTGDKIGVRAYSSAIATVAAYPYHFQTQNEVARLPGCGQKIALLYQEYRTNGTIQEVEENESDPKLQVLKQFYDIWGVGETTAREFYNKGWRDIDDVVEYGWDGLTRVQQIGVKYYDEFLLKIPRREVEEIGNLILDEANNIEKGFEMVIVGGYRRGKKESGDVDVVLSHRDENATKGFVGRIVIGLEKRGYITHTLLLSTANTERGQEPVAWKGDSRVAGTGFDTLDKALVVWQDPDFEGEGTNPNPHRRVDIIISPWKTAGCAVLGWTSGTTFQRDLRRYCKKEKQLKFDSSGVRNRRDGGWVDLESDPNTGEPAPDMLTAEKRVFKGTGLEWRAPEERCTN